MFPGYFGEGEVRGTLECYRPSNKELDFVLPLSIREGRMVVNDDRMPGGRWNLSINWEYQGVPYLQKTEIILTKSP